MAGPVTRLYGIKRALLTRATSSRKRDARQCSPTSNIDVAVTERTFRHMRSGDHLCPQPHYTPQQKSHRLNQHIGAFRLNATGVSFHIL